jgi:hypothetical protein
MAGITEVSMLSAECAALLTDSVADLNAEASSEKQNPCKTQI